MSRNIVQEVTEYYRKHTPLIHRVFGDTYEGFPKPELLRYANLESATRVADLGSGFGGPSRLIVDQYPNVEHICCVNQSFAQLKIHARNLSSDAAKFHLLHGDYHSTGLSSNSFDRVLFLESLEHSYNLDKAMREAYRLLRAGGQIFIKGWFSEYPRKDWTLFTTAIEKANASCFHDMHDLVNSMYNAGFIDVKILPSCNKGTIQKPEWLSNFNDTRVSLLDTEFPIWDHMLWLRHAIGRDNQGRFYKTPYGEIALKGIDLDWLMQYFTRGPKLGVGFTYNHYVLVATAK